MRSVKVPSSVSFRTRTIILAQSTPLSKENVILASQRGSISKIGKTSKGTVSSKGLSQSIMTRQATRMWEELRPTNHLQKSRISLKLSTLRDRFSQIAMKIRTVQDGVKKIQQLSSHFLGRETQKQPISIQQTQQQQSMKASPDNKEAHLLQTMGL